MVEERQTGVDLMFAAAIPQIHAESNAERDQRLAWWREARFGMFIHWGLYAQHGRNAWAMNRECIPVADYEKLADSWHPGERPAREWARLAKQAGMKYMVMTTKHHEGFCLWDTKQTGYNALMRGPKRDLVREFVDACREFGLKVGFYYSLMDWHHPDALLSTVDEAARRRFLDFTHGCVQELCSNYGKIDTLWYDGAEPVASPEWWESVELNAMVRRFQPDILINNRSELDEDFGTPEGRVTPAQRGRAWEACMTMNGAWAYVPSAIDWMSARSMVQMLLTCSASNGNLLLNIGPAPDGSVQPEAAERLAQVGAWTAQNGEAMYGAVDVLRESELSTTGGGWSLKGNNAYYWCSRWVGSELVIGGLLTQATRASFLASGQPIQFEQVPLRLVLKGLPESNPDSNVGVCVIKIEFEQPPVHVLEYVYTPARFAVEGRPLEFVRAR